KLDFRIPLQKLRGQGNDLLFRSGDLQMGKNLTGNPLIDENSSVLRVILEFDDVAVAIVGFQKVRLRATPHLPDEAARVYRHTPRPKPESNNEETLTCQKKPNPPKVRTRLKMLKKDAMKWLWS